MAAEVSRLKVFLSANPRAFDEWMKLMDLLEAGGSPGETRSAYAAFLAEFPLCWGYWKRLADLETRESGVLAALPVYERAAKVASPCVDLWVHFSDAVRAAAAEGHRAEQEVRAHLERAIEAVGLDWRSGPVWDRYLDFEQANGDWQRLGALFRRALAVPMEALVAVRIRLRSLVVGDDCPRVEQLCTPEEVKAFASMDLLALATGRPQPTGCLAPGAVPGLAATCERPASGGADPSAGCNGGNLWQTPIASDAGRRQASEEGAAAAEGSSAVSEAAVEVKGPAQEATAEGAAQTQKVEGADCGAEGRELSDGELSDGEVSGEEPMPNTATEQPPRAPETAQPGPTTTSAGTPLSLPAPKAEDHRTLLMKDWLLDTREALFQRTAAEAEQLRHFEKHFQRPYFHNKALSPVQLSTWRRYLDFEDGRQPRVERRLHALYQRCLVATNNYLEFWLRYATQLSAFSGPEAARVLLADAWASGRLRLRPDALAAWAELEEQAGHPDRARELLDEALAGFAQGSVELVVRRVALERRAGDLPRCEALLRRHADAAQQLASRAFLARYHARFCEDAMGRPRQACDALLAAWKDGCRDPWLLAELAPLVMRAAAAHAAEAGGAANADGEGPVKEAMDKCVAIFEEALDPATTAYGPSEACIAWRTYVDFLLAHGGALERLISAQLRARQVAIAAAAVGGSAPSGAGAARPWPGQEPPSKCARTAPPQPPLARPVATPQQAWC